MEARKLWRAGVGTALFVTIAGCGSGMQAADRTAESAQGGENASTDLEQQFAREADPIQKHPVSGPAWKAYLEAKASPVVTEDDGFIMVSADLGWDANVNCYIYEQTIDAGGGSYAMLQAAAQKVTFRALAPYHLDHVGLDPILAIRGVYHVEQSGQTAAGDLKLTVMSRAELPIICTHDAPGYAESFARVATDFARSFEFESEMPAPARGELWSVLLDGVPVGFSVDKIYDLDQGNVRSVSLAARFMPVAPGQIAFEDQVSITDTNRDGAVLNGQYLSFENGEESMKMTLEKVSGEYRYAGTIQAKEVKGSFHSKRPILGAYALQHRLRQLAVKPKRTKFEQWEYLPTLDPSQPSQTSYEVIPEEGGLTVRASMGERAMVMRANNRGVLKQMGFAVGSRAIRINLLAERGEL